MLIDTRRGNNLHGQCGTSIAPIFVISGNQYKFYVFWYNAFLPESLPAKILLYPVLNIKGPIALKIIIIKINAIANKI